VKDRDLFYIRECLALARKGAGSVSPNPMVGALVVKNGKVIGRGYHQRFGEAHAEVNAIRNATASPEGATLYVSLEPCSFTGKTPPCTDLIIRSKIKRVVAAMKDPNPRVSGKGILQLQKAGIEVTCGIAEREAQALNESFTKFINTQEPFVALKIAQTLDGKIADKNARSKWITNEKSRRYVHQLRGEYDAVLVGAGTVHHDNPSLTVREVAGRNPVRVIVDGNFSVPEKATMFRDGAARTIVYINSKRSKKYAAKRDRLEKNGIEIVEFPGSTTGAISLTKILRHLGSEGIASVLVEGGAATFSHLIEQGQVDKYYIFIAPKLIGQGLDAFGNVKSKSLRNAVALQNVSVTSFGEDTLLQGYPEKKAKKR